MEIFNKKAVKPPKNPPGRQPIYSLEYMMMVAEKVIQKELSYREASKLYGASHGAIGSWVKQYRTKSWGKNHKATNQVVSQQVQNYRQETYIRDLKTEIAELYLETLVLKKIIQNSRPSNYIVF